MGWVYFIREGVAGPIKIGYTGKSAQSRRDTLQTGNPRQLAVLVEVPAIQAVEQEFHERFATFRMSGEWFAPNAELGTLVHMLTVKLRHNRAFAYDVSYIGVVPKRLSVALNRKMRLLASVGWSDAFVGLWPEVELHPDVLPLFEHEASSDDDLFFCPRAQTKHAAWRRLATLNRACADVYEAHNYAVERREGRLPPSEGSQVH